MRCTYCCWIKRQRQRRSETRERWKNRHSHQFMTTASRAAASKTRCLANWTILHCLRICARKIIRVQTLSDYEIYTTHRHHLASHIIPQQNLAPLAESFSTYDHRRVCRSFHKASTATAVHSSTTHHRYRSTVHTIRPQRHTVTLYTLIRITAHSSRCHPWAKTLISHHLIPFQRLRRTNYRQLSKVAWAVPSCMNILRVRRKPTL